MSEFADMDDEIFDCDDFQDPFIVTCICMVCKKEFIADVFDASYVCTECDEELNKE